MNNLQKSGGISAIIEAAIYIIAFIIYGAVLEYPSANANSIQRLKFLTDNQTTLMILNLVVYVLFSIVLVVLVLALHNRFKNTFPYLSEITSVFGFIWAGLVIASGMIGNIGLSYVTELGIENPEQAMIVWNSVSIVTEGLGGGNEIVGGVWVSLLSVTALKSKSFPKLLILLGFIVGLAGILTVYPADIFTELFGISQIIWFIWLGFFMLNNEPKSAD